MSQAEDHDFEEIEIEEESGKVDPIVAPDVPSVVATAVDHVESKSKPDDAFKVIEDKEEVAEITDKPNNKKRKFQADQSKTQESKKAKEQEEPKIDDFIKKSIDICEEFKNRIKQLETIHNSSSSSTKDLEAQISDLQKQLEEKDKELVDVKYKLAETNAAISQAFPFLQKAVNKN